ncbi:MAG: hypothetical protein IH626_22350 [Rhodospirillales bacterium]|nr:hypothetical protein [Rhodospirillales bacterium]
MEFHINRRVILNPQSEYGNLYRWSLEEFDADRKKAGRGQIPWHWTVYFTVDELALNDRLELKADYQTDSCDEKTGVSEEQYLTAKLRHDDWRGKTSFSMFGTDRTISSFTLRIGKLKDGEEQEWCAAWGSVSYTSEIDFRNETTEDCIDFFLHVRPETFARYAEKIATSAVDEVTFRVGSVAGFYSDWSPSITTDSIKVLTQGEEHKIEIPSNCDIDPPRLGKVMEADLLFRRLRKFKKPTPETFEEAGDWIGSDETPEELRDGDGQAQRNQRLAVAETRVVNLLSSVRTAAWAIAGLLLSILIASIKSH